MQSFPLDHIFYGGYITRQIGNAVAPAMAKIMFTACKESLEKTDGVQREVVMVDGIERDVIMLD